MQLIEIVQVVLLIFIVLSAIIFFFSYMGYRNKSKTKVLFKPAMQEKKEVVVKPNLTEKVSENPEIVKQNEPKKLQDSIKQNPRFEVFNPTPEENSKLGSRKSNKKKSHTPKTLIIKHKS